MKTWILYHLVYGHHRGELRTSPNIFFEMCEMANPHCFLPLTGTSSMWGPELLALTVPPQHFLCVGTPLSGSTKKFDWVWGDYLIADHKVRCKTPSIIFSSRKLPQAGLKDFKTRSNLTLHFTQLTLTSLFEHNRMNWGSYVFLFVCTPQRWFLLPWNINSLLIFLVKFHSLSTFTPPFFRRVSSDNIC